MSGNPAEGEHETGSGAAEPDPAASASETSAGGSSSAEAPVAESPVDQTSNESDALDSDALASGALDAEDLDSDAAAKPPATDLRPGGVGLSDAEATLAELDVPDPEIPDPVIPAAALAEPVIPPPAIPPAPEGLAPALPDPASPAVPRQDAASNSADTPVPATRAERRTIAGAPPAAPALPPDPAVVPPPTGATAGSYRGWTIAIFSILFLLLLGAVTLVVALLAGGVSPFPSASAFGMGSMRDAGSKMQLIGAAAMHF